MQWVEALLKVIGQAGLMLIVAIALFALWVVVFLR
jgi:hypothetical protein